jgi:hypothetical protein
VVLSRLHCANRSSVCGRPMEPRKCRWIGTRLDGRNSRLHCEQVMSLDDRMDNEDNRSPAEVGTGWRDGAGCLKLRGLACFVPSRWQIKLL